MKLISIVIPLYNKELYIARTLNSVLAQTYPYFNCIIIDSSGDRSTDVVKQFSDPRIIHLIRKKTGAAAARNIGVSLAQSDLIAFLDADDEWNPDHIQTLVSLYNTYPDAGLYSTPYIKIRANGSPMVMIFANIPKPPWEGIIPNYFKTCAHGDVPVNSSSCAIRRSIFEEMGGFQEDIIYGEDHHLWGRIALKYPVAFSWEGASVYHTEAEGRICNDPHGPLEDPFSLYLEQVIMREGLSEEIKQDIQAYIKRRRKTTWFSNTFSKLSETDDSLKIIKDKKNITLFTQIYTGCIRCIAFLPIWLINSSLINQLRRLWCLVHGWHIPSYKKE